MTIHLKPEQERIIQGEIAKGHFSNPEEVIEHLLAMLRDNGRGQEESTAPRKNLAQFLLESPLAGAELNLERQPDYGRSIEI